MRRFVPISTLVILLAVTLAVPTLASGTSEKDPISPELLAALKAPLTARIAELRKEKNELGAAYVYGSYYNNFSPVDGGYEATFIKRISGPDEMVAERFTMTLREEGGAWQIADEKLEHTVEGLMYRSVPGDETFYKFDSFSLDREGLKISGGKGELIVDYRNGEPFRFWFIADDLQYDYMTPVELGWYGQVLKLQMKKFPKDIVFKPQDFTVYCTPGMCEDFLSTMFVGKTETSLDQVRPKFRKEYDDFVRDLEKGRKDSPLAGYQPVKGPAVQTWSIIIKRNGRDHWATLSYDNEARHEVKFKVTALGERKFYGFPLFVYNSEETRNSGIDPYELERRDDIYSDSNGRFTLDYDVVGLTGSVEMAITDDEMMTCDFTYEMLAKRDFDWLPFYVAQGVRRPGQEDDDVRKKPTLDVYAMEDGEGNDLTYVRNGKTFGLIVFPETVKAGETIKLHVKFDNGGSIYKHNHTYSRVNRSGWAPFVTFSDNIDYLDLEISVDAKYQILGIDNKVSESVKDSVRTARYRSDFPLTFPTIIFGDYETRSSKIQAKKSDGTVIPVNVHVDKTSMRGFTRTSMTRDDRAYNRLAGAAGGEDADTQFDDMRRKSQADGALGVRDIRPDALVPIGDQAVNAINLYQEIFGIDYPFAKLDLVNDPLGSFYGQAPPSIVYLGFGVFYPTARVNIGSRGDISAFQNTVVAHELGHQWWGSAVVNPNQGNYWFVESLAEYSSALYSEAMGRASAKDPKKAAKKGWAAYMKNVDEWHRMLISRPNLFTSVQHSDSMMPGIEPAARTAAIYNKGPYSFHMMRLLFGDEKFFKFLKDLAQKFEGKTMSTRDLQMTAEQSLCGFDEQGNPCTFDLEWFFDQWIRGVGIPEYSFNYTYREAEDGTWIVEGDIRQRVVLGADRVEMPDTVFRGRTKITVVDKKGVEYNVPVVIDAEVTPFAFKVPEEPFEVVMNKDKDMLARAVHVNTTW